MTLEMTSCPWHLFVNVCLHSRSFSLPADWRKSDSSVDGEPQGNWRRNSNSRASYPGQFALSELPEEAWNRVRLREGVLGEFSQQAWLVTAQPKSPRTTGNEAANSRDVVASSPSFSHPAARAPPGQLARRLQKIRLGRLILIAHVLPGHKITA